MSRPILPNGTTSKQVSTPYPPGSLLAAIYARVSTEDQGKGFSLPSQIAACQTLASKSGYTVPDSHVFTDEMSGTT
jgi:pyruvoyl-dependent arginine decarboxylase (PvlArgDC)